MGKDPDGADIGTLAEAHQVALRAIALAREALHEGTGRDLMTSYKEINGDAVTTIDFKCESLIISTIKDRFANHRIISEECGELPGLPEWTWLIDPLDGTNNIILDLPLFGSCVTLCHRGQPAVAAIYVSHEDATYSAVAGQGAFRNGSRIFSHHNGTPGHATVSWINGYAVASDDLFAQQALAVLDRRFKRTLSLWAPAVDWALLAKGRTGAVVAYENELEDLLCGALIAAEAGAVVTDFAGNAISDLSSINSLVVSAPEIAPYMAAVLSELR